MQTYDIVMLAVLGGATLFGLLKGFAWQVASVASLVLSYMCALRFADQLAPLLNADPRWSKYLAMLIIYCAVGMGVWMLFRFISGTIDKIKLREFDRQLGALVGMAKGALLCTVITFFAVSLNADSRAAVLKSKSGYYISAGLHKAAPIMPPEWTAMLGPYLDKLERGLDPNQEVEHPQLSMPQVLSPELQQNLQQLQQLQQGLPPGYGPPPGQGGYPQPGYQQNFQQPGGFVPNNNNFAPPQPTQPNPYYVPPQAGGYSSGGVPH